MRSTWELQTPAHLGDDEPAANVGFAKAEMVQFVRKSLQLLQGELGLGLMLLSFCTVFP